MIRALIADDEKQALIRLKDLLADYNDFEIVGEAVNGSDALEKIIDLKPDVAFLDIHMPGISVFKSLASLGQPPLVVFQTAHADHAVKAFDINAVDYLLKPFSRDRFRQAVERIRDTLEQRTVSPSGGIKPATDLSNTVTVKDRGVVKLVPLKDVIRISFEDGLCFIHSGQDRFMSDRSLNYYEEKLKDAGFFRSSRAHLINLEQILAIHAGFKGGHFIELKDHSKVELSRRKAQQLKKLIDF